MERKTKAKTLTAIFALSAIIQSMNAMALIISGVAKAFPEVSAASAQSVFSTIMLISVGGTLLAGKLANFTTKKKLTILFSIILLAGGLVGYFLGNNMVILYLASVLIGIGNGGLIPISSALIAEHFTGGERATITGQQSLFVNGGSILLNMAAGMLAASNWRNTYLIMLATIPIMILTWLLLPEGSVEKKTEGEKGKVFNSFLTALVVQTFIFGVTWMTLLANAAYLVYDLGIGNETQASYLTMTNAVGGILIGLVLRKVLVRTKKYCFAFAFSCGTAGLWLFVFAKNLPLLIIASVLMGFAVGTLMPSGFTLIPSNVAPAAITMGISLFSAAFALGGFFNPYIITVSASLVNDNISTRFLVAALLQTANLIFCIITTKRNKAIKVAL